MYNTLLTTFKGSKDDSKSIYAPFDALCLLIGDKNARILCKSRAGVSSRPPLNSDPDTGVDDVDGLVIDVDMVDDTL